MWRELKRSWRSGWKASPVENRQRSRGRWPEPPRMHRDGAPAHRQERRLNSAARGTADNRSAQPAPDRATGTAKGPKGQQGNAGTTATPASRARPPHAHAGLARGEGRKRSRGQVGRSNASGTAQAGMSGETVTHRVRQRWRGGSAGPPHHQSKSAVVKRKASRRSSRRRGGERRRRPDRPFPLRRGTTQWGLTATSAPISCAVPRADRRQHGRAGGWLPGQPNSFDGAALPRPFFSLP